MPASPVCVVASSDSPAVAAENIAASAYALEQSAAALLQDIDEGGLRNLQTRTFSFSESMTTARLGQYVRFISVFLKQFDDEQKKQPVVARFIAYLKDLRNKIEVELCKPHRIPERLEAIRLLTDNDTGTDLSWHTLKGLPLWELKLRNTNLQGTRFDEKQVAIICAGKYGRVPNFRGTDLTDLNLEGCRLDQGNFIGADISGTNFRGASLTGTRFGYKEITQIMAEGTRLGPDGFHHFRGIILESSYKHDMQSFAGLDLRGAEFDRLDLSQTSLARAKLIDIKCERVWLTAATFAEILAQNCRGNTKGLFRFKSVFLRDADARGFDFTGLSLYGIDWKGSDLRGAKINNGHLTEIILRGHFRLKRLSGADRDGDIERAIPEENDKAVALTSALPQHRAFMLLGLLPDNDENLINGLRTLAIDISRMMQSEKFQGKVHGSPNATVVTYIEQVLADVRLNKPQYQYVIPKLEEALDCAQKIYLRQPDFLASKKKTPLLRLPWFADLKNPQTEEVITLAAEIRRRFDVEDPGPQTRELLLHTLIGLDVWAFGHLYHEKTDSVQSTARKMAGLVGLAYGMGFGHQGWLEVAQRLMTTTDADTLKRLAILAQHMTATIAREYHELFDPVIAGTHKDKFDGKDWFQKPQDAKLFVSTLLRERSIFQLEQHVKALEIAYTQNRVPEKVLQVLAEPEGSLGLRALGGKGHGLQFIADQAPAYFVLTPHQHNLKNKVKKELAQLEQKTGHSFAEGTLRIAVRSSSAISMPGLMDTYLNVGSLEELFEKINAVYKSWDNPGARLYRSQQGIPDDWGTAVVIMEMADPLKDEISGSGIFNSLGRLSYGRQVWGGDLVKGKHEGKDPLPEGVREELEKTVYRLEEKLGYPVGIEFVAQSGKLKVLQQRRAHFDYEDDIRWASSRVAQGRLTREKALDFLGGAEKLEAARISTIVIPKQDAYSHDSGFAGGKPVTGRLYSSDWLRNNGRTNNDPVILAAPDADAASQAVEALKYSGVIFAGGNPLAHLVDLATGSGLPFLGGFQLQFQRDGNVSIDKKWPFEPGAFVTLDPAHNKIYRGKQKIVEGPSTVVPQIDYLKRSKAANTLGLMKQHGVHPLTFKMGKNAGFLNGTAQPMRITGFQTNMAQQRGRAFLGINSRG